MTIEWDEYGQASKEYWATYEKLQEEDRLNLEEPEYQAAHKKLDKTWLAWMKSEGKPIPAHYAHKFTAEYEYVTV